MWLIALALVLVVSVLPVMLAARLVNAGQRGFWRCLAALFVSSLVFGFAARTFHFGAILSIFASAVGYMLILDTTYLRGLGVAFLHIVLTLVLVVVIAATMFGGIMHGLDGLMHQGQSLHYI
jgi:hypothetical protein